MLDRFGPTNITSPEGFYAAVNRVQSGYIRTEADEVHYNLHVMLRFDLERSLISGAPRQCATLRPHGTTASLPISASRSIAQPWHVARCALVLRLDGVFPDYTLGNLTRAA